MSPGPDLKDMFLKVCLHWTLFVFHLMHNLISLVLFSTMEFRSFMALKTKSERKTGNDFQVSFQLPCENVSLLTMEFEKELE